MALGFIPHHMKYNYISSFKINYILNPWLKCGGPDSNRRIPTEADLESAAFDLARQPPRDFANIVYHKRYTEKNIFI